ncbi:MAG TPA: hypothetical protein VNZ03_16560 [Terriglobales bacterium]|nr:hypothetical protein [Terriglobales bacterium]
MAFEKVGYWLAVGVLALFVSNHFAVRYENDVRSLASWSLTAAQHVAGDATGFMAAAETMLGRGGIRFAQTQTTLACAQTRLASMQTVLAQHEASLARVEAVRARMVSMQELRGPIICPRQHLRIGVRQPSRDGTL